MKKKYVIKLTREMVYEELRNEIDAIGSAYFNVDLMDWEPKNLLQKVEFLRKEKIIPPELIKKIDQIWRDNRKEKFEKTRYKTAVNAVKEELNRIEKKSRR